MTLRYSTDIVIFGGGVAGLWILQRLRQQGYQALLLETDCLGGGQTIASQGIIHGGLKYALGGGLTGATQAIAAMPARWRRSLAGAEQPDLSGVDVLSDHYFMWSEAGIRSRLKAFLGSKSLRGRIESVPAADYPPFFQSATAGGSLYRLPDFVVDTPSLLEQLARPLMQSLFKIDPAPITFSNDEQGQLAAVDVACQHTRITIAAKRFIFAAGAGNQPLIQAAALQRPRGQERPLHMVYLRQSGLPAIYVHCIDDDFSLTPKLTVTSHPLQDGDMVWYLGGGLAESGVGKSEEEQIVAAQALCKKLFPWVDVAGASWHSFTIKRAEAGGNKGYRPDDAYLLAENNALVAWPTKLTLTPLLADKVLTELADADFSASTHADLAGLRQHLPAPTMARAGWENFA